MAEHFGRDLWDGEGPGELPLLLQDRGVPPRPALLATPHPAEHQPHPPPLQHVERIDNAVTPGPDSQGQPIDPSKIQEHFENFYQVVFEELSKFGKIESLNVCDNLADHLVGNVYVKFRDKDDVANDILVLLISPLLRISVRLQVGNSRIMRVTEGVKTNYLEDIEDRKDKSLWSPQPWRLSPKWWQPPEAEALFHKRNYNRSLVKEGSAGGGRELNSGTGKRSRQMLLGRTMNPSRVVDRIKMKRVITLYGFLVQYS
ncbi:splicing factor U2af small subunit [Musa troglodytarum]|uniref:Splicing factor U2af small subunit n=1 Tax=Musa troglodytarum TaxID=320322 RepID=A0A9E7ES26_9LILI|nr:splicing factor U2af small subunit [Musa troglodytarum]